jgi:excisionase family DNA binding protein
MSELLTVQEAADKAKVCTMTVRRAIKAQALPSLRFGRAIRVAESDLENYLRRDRTTGKALEATR